VAPGTRVPIVAPGTRVPMVAPGMPGPLGMRTAGPTVARMLVPMAAPERA
jgi:hypothetical protein